MTKRQHRSTPEAILGQAGGNATASGVDLQAKLGAWFATHMLTERPLDAQLTGAQVQSLRFETEAPIDDILVEIEEGWI